LILEREQDYLDSLEPEYNTLKIAGSSLGQKRSEETKAILSEVNKGENNPMYGRTGENHPMFGFTHPIETPPSAGSRLFFKKA